MKNKIIKTICFSLLALSVALCAVFTLPKKDTFTVNANGLTGDSVPYNRLFPIYGISSSGVRITVPNSSDIIIDGSLYTPNTFYIPSSGYDQFRYGYLNISTDSTGLSDDLVPIEDINVVGGNIVYLFSVVDYSNSIYINNLTFYGSSFVVPYGQTLLSGYRFYLTDISTLDFIPFTYVYTVTYGAITAEGYIENTITSSSDGTVTEFRPFELINSISLTQSSYINILSYSFTFGFSDINVALLRAYETTVRLIDDLEYAKMVDLFISSYPSEIIVEEVTYNPIGQIVQMVDSFLSTEILPDFSFYDILILALAIPLVVWILKAWLGG